jgi:Secretion system C-terminal sorting domain
LENFENSDGYFYTDGINSSWQYGQPSATLINQAASGHTAWKTNLTGKHNNDESSYLYSPCFDLSALQNPAISISLALNIDSCALGVFLCDYMRMQYSSDGFNWAFLPLSLNRYNWPPIWTSKNYFRWHVATNFLSAGQTNIRFRFFFNSTHEINNEGAAIDDIHIYDRKNPIYDSTLSGIPLTQSASGGHSWVEFLQDQKIIASINPYGQNLGNTVLKSYIKPIKPVSNFHGQYYLNRSFTITAENKNLTDSIGIRLYYLDSEADSLLFARNCINCSKPANAYRLGISQYSTDSLSEENDSIPDNINGNWSFIENRKIKIVPYDKGYYAEFKVKNLSEFRLNSGGPNQQSYLPVNLLNFSATKSTNDITDLVWTVASEINIKRYEIEVAKGNEAFTNKQFIKLSEVTSSGPTAQNRTYNFADVSPSKSGVLYYRLKIFDEFGNFSYSRAIPVLYSKELKWKVFPNPSYGLFTLQYQLSAGEKGIINIYNSLGQPVKSQTITGTGYVQTIGVDMKNSLLSRGIYLVKIAADNNNEALKLIIQ